MNSVQDLVRQRDELARQQQELNQQIEAARRSERAGVIAQIKALMAEHGVTLAELSSGKPARGSAKASGPTGSKVAPKYRHPDSGETWSGRGLKPKWLQAEIAGGKALDDFKI